jgi:transmembrane sensor
MPDRESDREPQAIREQLVRWLAWLDSGECTREDRSRFEAWLAEDEGRRAEFERARALWDRVGGLRSESIPQMAAARAHAGPSRAGMRIAASLAVFGIACLMALLWLGQPEGDRIAYATVKGERLDVVLPDGSDLQLNTDSAVSIAYTRRSRTIHLERGEALFTVKPGDARPFEVLAAGGEIRDLGTRFSVHREAGRVSVVVVEGAVTVKTAESAFRLPLSAGERVDYDAAGRLSATGKVDADASTAWSRGRLVFDDVTVAEVARQVARYHDVRLVIDDPALGQLRVSGTFRTDDLDSLIDTLEILLPLAAETAAPGVIRLRTRG